MDARLRPLGAETSTAAAIPTYTGEDRQPQQAGLGGKGRARTRPEDDRSRCDIQTEAGGRKGRNGEVSHYCVVRLELDLTFTIKVTATMMLCTLLRLQQVWLKCHRGAVSQRRLLLVDFCIRQYPAFLSVEFWRTRFHCFCI